MYTWHLVIEEKKVSGKSPLNDVYVGSTHETKQFGEVEVLSVTSALDVTVKFKNTGYIARGLPSSRVRTGRIADPYHPFAAGLGYRGEGVYKVKDHRELYHRWSNMFRKIYTSNTASTINAYGDCEVDKRWYNFQNYARWFYNQFRHPDESYDVDKDLKILGNRIYGPDTCLLIPSVLNTAISFDSKLKNPRSGVVMRNGRYCATIRRDSVLYFLGEYDNPDEAMESYHKAHCDLIFKMAERLFISGKLTKEIYDIVKLRYLKRRL
jgi:hypothetical protein